MLARFSAADNVKVTRVSALLGAIGVSCLIAAGCGTSTPSERPATSTADELAKAVAFAHAVNLQPADVPGLRVAGTERSLEPPDAPERSAFLACVGIHFRARALTETLSDLFTSTARTQPASLVSEVTVLASEHLENLSFAALQRSDAPRCLEREAYTYNTNRDRRAAPVRLAHATVTRLSTEGFGVPESVGFQLVTPTVARRNGRTLVTDSFKDTYEFRDGRAQIVLADESNQRPMSTAEARRLLALLHRRAESESP